MRVLIVKTSSLGDLIHSFPALSDAAMALPGLKIDWLVEEAFAEVPAWHSAVDEVITIGLRRWRNGLWEAWRNGEFAAFRKRLCAHRYDLIIDAQGLVKSAWPASWANGELVGYDKNSIREPWSCYFYQRTFAVDRKLNAITRVRQLFAHALDYSFDEQRLNYGLRFTHSGQGQVILMHSTTWPSKHYPEAYWAELACLVEEHGLQPVLPWYQSEERLRAERIVKLAGKGELLPRMGLQQMAEYLASCSGAVGVDSGLAHIAAAIGVPAVTIYGSTSVELTGAMGAHQQNLSASFECAPCMRRSCNYASESFVVPACYESLTPTLVWNTLKLQMEAI